MQLFARLLIYLLFAVLAGCASYGRNLDKSLNLLANNQPQAALNSLPSDSGEPFLEAVETAHLTVVTHGAEQGIPYYHQADEEVKAWEQQAKVNPSLLLQSMGSLLLNDRVYDYSPPDYEKVFVTSKLAMLYAAKNDLDKARVAIKQTHEREAIIARFNEDQYRQMQEEVEAEGESSTSYRKLDGYPVKQFESEKVRSLVNSYQNALSHYLAGFVYESLNEPSLAAAGYRKAIELNSGSATLESGLAEMEQRLRNRQPQTTDLLIVVENGTIAKRESLTVPVPVPVERDLMWIPMSFPVYRETAENFNSFPHVKLDGETQYADPIMDVDAMAIRDLKDKMPWIITRSIARASLKAAAQYQARKQDPLLGFAVGLSAFLTEGADERMWRTLPSEIRLIRLQLPYGEHQLEIGSYQTTIAATKPAQVLPVRVIGQSVYFVHQP